MGSRRFAEVTACRELLALFGRIEAPKTSPPGFLNGTTPGAGLDCYESMGYPANGWWELFGDPRSTSREVIALRTLTGTLMQRVHFDLREFQRVLMATRAYQSEACDPAPRGESVFSRPPVPQIRRLTPEQIWDSLVLLGGPDGKEYRFSSELPQTLPEQHPLRLLGRGERLRAEDANRDPSHHAAMVMQQSELVRRITRSESALLTSVNARFPNSPVRQAEALFLAVLNRMPGERERAQAIGGIAAGPEGAGQVVWSLLNTGEFLFAR